MLLDEQDRSLCDRALIAEGVALARRAVAVAEVGNFALQAAIAAVHAEAPSEAETDWARVVALYDLLAQVFPSPVVELDRAVAGDSAIWVPRSVG